jgi:sugar O-acyltransferase (sialic acid O-acetyltransferase NeuD family)
VRLILWGATGQAKVLRECAGRQGIEVVAVFDNDPHVPAPFADVPLFHGWAGFEEWHRTAAAEEELRALVAIGGEHGRDRIELQQRIEAAGIAPWTAIHDAAFVATDAVVGAGSQVLAQSAVCAGAELGVACIVNTGAVVDHECRLGAGAHVGPGANLAGLVDVGESAFVGAGATVLPRVTIGADAIVGAGAVVREDVAPGAVVVGSPARVIRVAAPQP